MAKVYISSNIKDFSGLLNSKWPYVLQKDGKGGIYTRRVRAYEGGFDASHWKFLCALAKLCDNRLYITDIEVSADELAEALSEKHACKFLPLQVLKWTGQKSLHVKEFKQFDAWLKEHGIDRD